MFTAELPRRLRRHPFVAEGELLSGHHAPLPLSFREEGELGLDAACAGAEFPGNRVV
jgi:hypothetical protein